MQVSSTTQSYSTTSDISTKKAGNETSSFKIESDSSYDPLDISFEEYKNLTKEDIEKMYPYSYSSKDNWKYTDEQRVLHEQASSLLGLSLYSEDPLLNEVLFDLQKEEFKEGKLPGETGTSNALLGITLVMGMEEPIVFPPEFAAYLEASKDDIHYDRNHPGERKRAMESLREVMKPEPLTYDYFNYLIKKLHEDYNGSITQEGRKLIDDKEMFKNLQNIVSEYEKRKSENEAALEQMTSSSKPASLEEAQKQKDEEQYRLAMEEHGLDPDNYIDRFTFELMGEGYSKNAAKERTFAYQMIGLVRDPSLEENSNYVSLNTRSSVLSESMVEAFEKMSTPQLKNIAGRLMIEFALPANEIFGEDKDLTPQEVQKRVDQYWDRKFPDGNNSILELLYTKKEAVDSDQKYSSEDLTYVKDGFDILIDIFKENLEKEKSL